MKKIDVKKELTEEEFQSLIKTCENKFNLKNNLKDIASECEEKAKEITPATYSCLLIPDLDNHTFYIPTRDISIPLNLGTESILTQCYNTRQPFIVNDVTRSFLYHHASDNFLNLELKDLLLIPITDESIGNQVIAIIWSAITLGSWNQYTQKDLDYMVRFSLFTKRFLQGERKTTDKSNNSPLNVNNCMEIHDKLRAQIRREQEYFSAIIHDVRTPMNAVMGFLELLSLQEKNSEKKEYLETALKSAQTMVALINDALDISKMANGKMDIEKIRFSPHDELSDVAKLFHNTAQKKNICFTAYYDPAIPNHIYSDYHRIKQIINNLLSNAIKFTPENGEILLEMLYDKEKDGLLVSVYDNGIGISKEKQKDIFTPYTQEKSSTSRKYGGTGLGLSISQQLSVLLGGKLQLKSEEGKGSRFYFTIPCNTDTPYVPTLEKTQYKDIVLGLYVPDESHPSLSSIQRYFDYFQSELYIFKTPEELAKAPDLPLDILIIFRENAIFHDTFVQDLLDKNKSAIILGDTFLNDGCHFTGNILRINTPILPIDLDHAIQNLIQPNTSNTKEVLPSKFKTNQDKNILIVDDNTINLKFMKEVIKKIGFEPLLAQNGEESIEIFKNKPIDLIFMDENMPGIQGQDAIMKIRKWESKKKDTQTIIIGLTGDADEETKKSLQNSGANEVLTKPVQLQEIIRVITDYL